MYQIGNIEPVEALVDINSVNRLFVKSFAVYLDVEFLGLFTAENDIFAVTVVFEFKYRFDLGFCLQFALCRIPRLIHHAAARFKSELRTQTTVYKQYFFLFGKLSVVYSELCVIKNKYIRLICRNFRFIVRRNFFNLFSLRQRLNIESFFIRYYKQYKLSRFKIRRIFPVLAVNAEYFPGNSVPKLQRNIFSEIRRNSLDRIVRVGVEQKTVFVFFILVGLNNDLIGRNKDFVVQFCEVFYFGLFAYIGKSFCGVGFLRVDKYRRYSRKDYFAAACLELLQHFERGTAYREHARNDNSLVIGFSYYQFSVFNASESRKHFFVREIKIDMRFKQGIVKFVEIVVIRLDFFRYVHHSVCPACVYLRPKAFNGHYNGCFANSVRRSRNFTDSGVVVFKIRICFIPCGLMQNAGGVVSFRFSLHGIP